MPTQIVTRFSDSKYFKMLISMCSFSAFQLTLIDEEAKIALLKAIKTRRMYFGTSIMDGIP